MSQRTPKLIKNLLFLVNMEQGLFNIYKICK